MPAAKQIARQLAASPASVSRRPIVDMALAIADGKIKSRYIAVPSTSNAAERANLAEVLEERLKRPEEFVVGVEFVFDATLDSGIATYDAKSGYLRINGLHPFVGAFYEQFSGVGSGLPLDLFAMAEVLLEAQLYQTGNSQQEVDIIMLSRDRYLRDVAQSSGPRTALVISKALQDSRNDEDKLEDEVVAAFKSLGFDAARDGRNGKADGVARADLSADDKGKPRHYSVTLEAKSTQKDGKSVSAATVNIAIIAKHRDE